MTWRAPIKRPEFGGQQTHVPPGRGFRLLVLYRRCRPPVKETGGRKHEKQVLRPLPSGQGPQDDKFGGFVSSKSNTGRNRPAMDEMSFGFQASWRVCVASRHGELAG